MTPATAIASIDEQGDAASSISQRVQVGGTKSTAVQNHWLGRRRYQLVKRAFAAAEKAIHRTMANAGDVQERELNGALSEYSTISSFRGTNGKIQARLREEGITFEVKWTHTGAQEETIGADFFVELDVKTPEFQTKKGMLVQGKRLKDANKGPGTRDTDTYTAFNPKQAERMLVETASSYYLLYNPPRVKAGSIDLPGGLTWVAASTMKGFPSKPSFRDVVGHQVGFSEFLMDGFLQTIIGDPNLSMDDKGIVHRWPRHTDNDIGVPAVLRIKYIQDGERHH